MKNATEHTGTLQILERLRNSPNGNPRYLVAVLDHVGTGYSARTKPDSALAYELPNYEGKQVRARIGTHHGVATIDDIRPA